ncbi:MAG: hypothetical protein ABJK28_10410 [Algibacter sp.]
MKKILGITFIMVFCHLKLYSQTDIAYEIRNINLEIRQSRMIPYNHVKLVFSHLKNKVVVKIESNTGEDSEKWDYSRINKTFNISIEDFLELKNSLEKIELKDIFKVAEYSYKDGYVNSLSYGGFGGTVSLKFQTPSSRTQERGIEDYLKACILILKKGRFEDSVIKKILQVENL